MQNGAWVELLRLVPENLHHNLLIVTADGSEVCVSNIVRMEPEYLLVRGRVGGTSDVGLAFFIPYDRIVFVRGQKPVPDEVLYGLYGLRPPEQQFIEEAALAETVEDKPAGDENSSPCAPGATPTHGVSRQELLERLRLRRQQGSRTRSTPHNGMPLPPGEPAATAPHR
jgi:hypothetical protein